MACDAGILEYGGIFAVGKYVPIFILLALGVWLMQRKVVNDAFVEVGVALSFYAGIAVIIVREHCQN